MLYMYIFNIYKKSDVLSLVAISWQITQIVQNIVWQLNPMLTYIQSKAIRSMFVKFYQDYSLNKNIWRWHKRTYGQWELDDSVDTDLEDILCGGPNVRCELMTKINIPSAKV